MKKILLTLLALVGLAATLWAVPAKPGVRKTVKGANGQEMTVMLRGDETFHYYVNTDGKPVRELEDGTWAEDTRDVKALWKAANQKRNYHRQQLAMRMRRAMKAPARVSQNNVWAGKKKGLLILVNFKDREMVNKEGSKAIFDQMLNGINNPYGDNYGSVREYFKAQSYDQFEVEFDVVGPVTVSQNMSYYGANDSEGNDKHPEEMIKEACDSVKNQVNFADYDWDGDGEVENIYVTYAGYGESSRASENTIWPHQWSLSEAGTTLKRDGVKINTYACGSELYGTSGTTIDGIGTMCHEYSHCLGLPDFYDIDYSGGHGMFDWDVMDGGSYNDDGYCPAAYTAYEREFCGWLTYTELNSATKKTDMPNIEDNPVAYVVYNDGNANEYYVLANHQQKGWNKEEAGHGMLIIHVDYDEDVWDNNGPNDDPKHQRMTIIPADNEFDYKIYNGDKYYYANDADTWPGTKNKTALTDTSTPGAKLHNKNTDGMKLMHKPIEDITEVDGLISFRFMGGIPVDVPEGLAASNVSNTSFQVTWTAVEDAASYNLRLNEKVENGETVVDKLTLSESFDKFRTGNETDVSNSLDKYTDLSGWTGVKVFTGDNGAKLGTNKAVGYMETPILNNTSGTMSIYVEAMSWEADNSGLKVTVLDENGRELTDEPWILDLEANDAAVYEVKGMPNKYKVKFSTQAKKKRVHLEKVLIFDGEVTAEQATALDSPISSDVSTLFKDITDTQYTFTDLMPESRYTVQVQTVDGEGNTSAWSEAVAVVTLAEPDEPEYPLGDIDKDGRVSVADVTILVNLILTSAEPTTETDVDGDGRLSVADVTKLVNIILGRE